MHVVHVSRLARSCYCTSSNRLVSRYIASLHDISPVIHHITSQHIVSRHSICPSAFTFASPHHIAAHHNRTERPPIRASTSRESASWPKWPTPNQNQNQNRIRIRIRKRHQISPTPQSPTRISPSRKAKPSPSCSRPPRCCMCSRTGIGISIGSRGGGVRWGG